MGTLHGLVGCAFCLRLLGLGAWAMLPRLRLVAWNLSLPLLGWVAWALLLRRCS